MARLCAGNKGRELIVIPCVISSTPTGYPLAELRIRIRRWEFGIHEIQNVRNSRSYLLIHELFGHVSRASLGWRVVRALGPLAFSALFNLSVSLVNEIFFSYTDESWYIM